MLGCRRVTEHGLEVLDLAPLRVVDHLGAVQAAVDVGGNVAGLLAHNALPCLYQFVDDLLLAVTGDCEHFTSNQALADGDHCHGLIAAPIQFKLDTKYKSGAGDGLRTRYLNLGKVALYRVSYSRSLASPMVAKEVGAGDGNRTRVNSLEGC